MKSGFFKHTTILSNLNTRYIFLMLFSVSFYQRHIYVSDSIRRHFRLPVVSLVNTITQSIYQLKLHWQQYQLKYTISLISVLILCNCKSFIVSSIWRPIFKYYWKKLRCAPPFFFNLSETTAFTKDAVSMRLYNLQLLVPYIKAIIYGYYIYICVCVPSIN